LIKERRGYNTQFREDPVSLPKREAIEVIGEEFGEQDQTLSEFVNGFIEEHAVKGAEGGEIVLDVSSEEYETVGRSFIRLMVGWAAGLNGSRRRRGILPSTLHDDHLEDFNKDKEVLH
jgi:hypothetical protein